MAFILPDLGKNDLALTELTGKHRSGSGREDEAAEILVVGVPAVDDDLEGPSLRLALSR